jgi:hypothetical protein
MNFRTPWRICFLLICLVMPYTSASAMSATKMRFKTMCVGPVSLYADNRGDAKLVTLFGMIVITQERHSIGYNDSSKTYYEYASPDQFANSNFVKFLDRYHSLENEYKPWGKLDATTKNGWPLTRYRRSYLDNRVQFSKRLFKHYTEVVMTSNSLNLPYEWVVPWVTALGAACPPNTMPMYFYGYLDNRVVQRRLELESITTEEVPGDFFSAPEGYKLAHDDAEVFLGGSGFAELYYKSRMKSADITKGP